MRSECKDTKRGGRFGLPVALAVVGLLMAGGVTPLLANESCDVGRSCEGGTIFECGTSPNCVCGFLDNKCKWV
jgi:hypothetical protein